MTTAGRNQPCPCGSGRKFKKCCGKKVAEDNGKPPAATAAEDDSASEPPERVKVIDRRTMDAITGPIKTKLDEIAEELGVSISMRRASYCEINAKIELEVATIRSDGLVMDKLAEEFMVRCRDFGLEQDDLGRVFRCGAETFRVVGLKPRAKAPVVCESVGSPEDLRRVRMSSEAVREHLAKGDDSGTTLRLLRRE
jgi:hypothetical protein